MLDLFERWVLYHKENLILIMSEGKMEHEIDKQILSDCRGEDGGNPEGEALDLQVDQVTRDIRSHTQTTKMGC